MLHHGDISNPLKESEGFDEGFPSMPVNWSISSDAKRGFHCLLGEITENSQ
jgi:hypothetical protein